MRSTRYIICAAVSFAVSLVALAGMSLPELNGFAVVNFPVGAAPEAVTVGDFNGDGKFDLAVANYDSDNISVLLGFGDGTFLTTANLPDLCFSPITVATGDFNGDGKLDIAAADINSDNVSVLFGNGNGTFQTATSYPTGDGPNFIIATNVDNDATLDLVTANPDGNNISVLLGNAGGTFQSPIHYTAGTNPSSVAAGSFNGDNKLDLVVTNRRSNNVSILLNRPGTATFARPNQFFTIHGGAGSVNVSTIGSCEWTAVSNDNWIVITSLASESGNGRIDYEVRENFTGSARQGTITAGGAPFTVIQDGGSGEGCSYSISPTSQSYTPDVANGTINVTASESCAWQAVSDSSWITFTSSNYGIGNGTITYFVAANFGSTARKGKITVGGQPLSIKQKSH